MHSARAQRTFAAIAVLSALVGCNAILGSHDRSLIEEPDRIPSPNLDARASNPDGTADVDVDGGVDAATDAATDAAIVYVGCLGDAACERVVFTTSQAFKGGELGGLVGGDAKCQAVADLSANPRLNHHRFRAWLSTTTQQAGDRHVKGTQPYRRVGDNVLLASTLSDLLNAGLQAPIANENGVVTGKGAWTGTLNNGNRSPDTCSDWTSTATNGLSGNPDQPPTWSSDPPAVSCNGTDAIICVEE